MMKLKKRLDTLLHELWPQYSRQQLQSWIMQGLVTVNEVAITKPGAQVRPDDHIELRVQEPRYVSRAGLKLERALDYFGIDVTGRIALDAGISTGGFTDCLLQHGVCRVYGIDVGYGQVHEKLRKDPRVIVMERTNLRTLEKLEPDSTVDIITLDLSFISVLKVLPTVVKFLKEGGDLIVLIKPQFEAERRDVCRGGIIKDPDVHKRVIEHVTDAIKAYGFTLIGVIDSPITGSSGNKEFLAYFKRSDLHRIENVTR